MSRWSFEDDEDEIAVGTQVCVGDSSPWGSGAKIIRKASIKDIIAEGYEIETASTEEEILYWVEYMNKNYPPEYVWRGNLYPYFLGE